MYPTPGLYSRLTTDERCLWPFGPTVQTILLRRRRVPGVSRADRSRFKDAQGLKAYVDTGPSPCQRRAPIRHLRKIKTRSA